MTDKETNETMNEAMDETTNPKDSNSLRELTQIAFQIIVKAGTAKSAAMEGIFASKTGDYDLAASKIKEAHESMIEAEKEHFTLIQEEAQGKRFNVPLILMHAEDQLLSTQTIIILGEELIEMNKKIAAK